MATRSGAMGLLDKEPSRLCGSNAIMTASPVLRVIIRGLEVFVLENVRENVAP
jgi:hypothetical protein